MTGTWVTVTGTKLMNIHTYSHCIIHTGMKQTHTHTHKPSTILILCIHKHTESQACILTSLNQHIWRCKPTEFNDRQTHSQSNRQVHFHFLLLATSCVCELTTERNSGDLDFQHALTQSSELRGNNGSCHYSSPCV